MVSNKFYWELVLNIFIFICLNSLAHGTQDNNMKITALELPQSCTKPSMCGNTILWEYSGTYCTHAINASETLELNTKPQFVKGLQLPDFFAADYVELREESIKHFLQ